MYIGDNSNHRIRKVAVSTGIITTIAGNGGTGSYSGDSGPATSATLNYPYGVSLDSLGTQILSYLHPLLLVTATSALFRQSLHRR